MVLPGPASPHPGQEFGGEWSLEPETHPHGLLPGSLSWTSSSQGKALWNADIAELPPLSASTFSTRRWP